MHGELTGAYGILADGTTVPGWVANGYQVVRILVGFSIIIFVHELGHFLACKWMNVRVNRFAVGFFYRLIGYRRGEGLTFGPRRTYTPEEVATKGYGETDYCLNALPFGGYVKMLGENDLEFNEQTGEIKKSDDPRSFTNKSIGRRMIVVSAGVVFNVVFAVLLYALVFLHGMQVQAPVIGGVEPATPEADAGLQAGDRITAVNGHLTSSWAEAKTAMLLADGPVRLSIQRPGESSERQLVVKPTDQGEQLGAALRPMFTATFGPSVVPAPDGSGPRPGDRITQVDGQPVSGALALMAAFSRSRGQPLELTVERPADEQGAAAQTVHYALRPRLAIQLADPTAGGAPASLDSTHLLGFQRRRCVFVVIRGSPAGEAGFRPGDVIVQWDNVISPRFAEILASIDAHENESLPVVVERAGEQLTLHVTPKREFKLTGSAKVRVGIDFGGGLAEDAKAVVADFVPGSPAAALAMPRGAELTAVGDRPVRTWPDVYEALRAAAGTTVEIRYRAGSDELSGRMAVPSSLVNELDLPPGALVIAIDGHEESAPSVKATARLSASTLAVRKLLEQKIGQTVRVTYAPDPLSTRHETKPFAVRSDNTDPWQLRCGYLSEHVESFALTPLTTTVSADGRPLRALAMGLDETGDTLVSIYVFVKKIIAGIFRPTGNVGLTQNIAGPVGIVQMAMHQESWPELMHFLALLSVNLAVINFLPMPVVDGGLMIFLLLEKLRGKALSIRVQVGITLAGLAVIVLCFLFVTFNDIARWINSGL